MYNIPTLIVDKKKLEKLQKVYMDAMAYIEDGLPNLDLNSRKEVLSFFEKTFKIHLTTTRIVEISEYIHQYGEDSEERDLIQGIVYYLKMKYAMKNYIVPMIKEAPNVELATRFEVVEMKNHQPLPKSPEIIECIVGATNGILLALIDGEMAIIVNDLMGDFDE